MSREGRPAAVLGRRPEAKGHGVWELATGWGLGTRLEVHLAARGELGHRCGMEPGHYQRSEPAGGWSSHGDIRLR